MGQYDINSFCPSWFSKNKKWKHQFGKEYMWPIQDYPKPSNYNINTNPNQCIHIQVIFVHASKN